MSTNAAAAPFGDDWDDLIKRMQESFRTPVLEEALRKAQLAQAPALQEAMRRYNASNFKLPPSIDLSEMTKAIRVSQNAQIQEAIKRLNSRSALSRWSEVARQFTAPSIPRIEAPLEAALEDLLRQLREAHAPGIERLEPFDTAEPEEGGAEAAGFDWIDLLPRKAKIRILIALLSVIGFLTQATAEMTEEEMPPGYVPLTAAAVCVAETLNELVGPEDDDAEATD